jgi:2-dehydro-3-deoxyphosphogluconate aldolase/(4S)-4-hydroxy-2-oxoglutarate aldolase
MTRENEDWMTIDQVIGRIAEVGIIPVVRAPNVKQALQAVEAIYAGGIPVVEITMTVPDAHEVIRQVVREYGDRVLTGAGTVLRSADAKRCLDAGAEFLVSPGLANSVLTTAAASGKLAIPGAMTPTELMVALENEARLIKIFPCGNLGGPKFLKSLKAPFPGAALIPTGGVNASNAAEYFKAGAFALGIGADLVDTAALREGNLSKITQAASELVEAVRSARQDRVAPKSAVS